MIGFFMSGIKKYRQSAAVTMNIALVIAPSESIVWMSIVVVAIARLTYLMTNFCKLFASFPAFYHFAFIIPSAFVE